MPTIITGGNTSGGSGSMKYGYFHDGGFYKHREEVGGEYVYTDPMTLKEKVIYTDMSTARQYIYDGTSLIELNGALFKMHVAVEDVVFIDSVLLNSFTGRYTSEWSSLVANVQSYEAAGKTVFAKHDNKNYAHTWLDNVTGELLFAFNDIVYRLKQNYGIVQELVSTDMIIDPTTGQIKPSMVPYMYDNIEKGYLHNNVFYRNRMGSGTTEDPYVYTQPYTPKDDTLYVDLGDNYKGYLYINGNFVPQGGSSHPYLSLERLRPFLYRVTFDAIPQDNGNNAPVGGGCSAFVANGKLHRNYDFNYDNAASFIVRTRDFEGMAMITGLNDGAMNDELIAQLPYRMVDGRNNNGIKLSVHLLYNDWEYTGAGQKSIPMTSLPYEILSRVKSMATISTDLADVLGNLAVTEVMGGYLLQCLVTDGTTTYAVVPPTSDNQSYELVNATSYPKMSNFRYVARAEVSRTDTDLQTRPTGIERFNMMPCELSDLRFTKAYEAADRLSEFIGIDDTTKASMDEELTAIYNEARAEYLDRERDGKTWQTMHSVVYGDKIESLWIQENWDDNVMVEIPTISTDIESDKTSDLKTASPKAVYDFATTPIDASSDTAISVALDCGKKYKYMNASGIASLAFTLNAPTDNTIVNMWYFKFRSGATATNVSFPSGLWYPNGEQPSIEANTIYEVMIDEDYCLTMQAYKQLSA